MFPDNKIFNSFLRDFRTQWESMGRRLAAPCVLQVFTNGTWDGVHIEMSDSDEGLREDRDEYAKWLRRAILLAICSITPEAAAAVTLVEQGDERSLSIQLANPTKEYQLVWSINSDGTLSEQPEMATHNIDGEPSPALYSLGEGKQPPLPEKLLQLHEVIAEIREAGLHLAEETVQAVLSMIEPDTTFMYLGHYHSIGHFAGVLFQSVAEPKDRHILHIPVEGKTALLRHYRSVKDFRLESPDVCATIPYILETMMRAEENVDTGCDQTTDEAVRLLLKSIPFAHLDTYHFTSSPILMYLDIQPEGWFWMMETKAPVEDPDDNENYDMSDCWYSWARSFCLAKKPRLIAAVTKRTLPVGSGQLAQEHLVVTVEGIRRSDYRVLACPIDKLAEGAWRTLEADEPPKRIYPSKD